MDAILRFTELRNTEVRITLNGAILIGSKIALHFTLPRVKGGRKEELRVSGTYQVSAMVPLQDGKVYLDVTSLGDPPVWRAVKGSPGRPLSPAKAPRTQVGD